jgi:hypothetical protein
MHIKFDSAQKAMKKVCCQRKSGQNVLTSFTTPTYLISTLTGNSSNIGVGQGK